MNGGFKKVFWGIFIATFNVNMGTYRILPPFIGWIVVAIGIMEIQKKSETVDYNLSKYASFILIGAALVGDIFKILGTGGSNPLFILLFYPVILMIIEFLLFYNLIETTIKSIFKNNLNKIVDVYVERGKTYILFAGIAILSATLSLFINFEILRAFTTIFTIVTRVFLLMTFLNLSKEDWGNYN